MNYSLHIGRRARRDLQQIYSWIAERSQSGAQRWFEAFERAASQVARDPLAFGTALGDEANDAELREFLFKTRRGRIYRGLFCIVEDEVRILRVRGPGQPPLRSDEIPET